jgi:hypothetical protein
LKLYPKLTLTVHDVIFSGERFAMRYTEHGRALEGVGPPCAWGGVGLYDWNGEKLSRNATQQDLFALDAQLLTGVSHPVEPPMISPWDTPPSEANPDAERIARDWLATGTLTTTKGVTVECEWAGKPVSRIVAQQSIEELDLFSAGDGVAFYVVQHGSLLQDFANDPRHVGRAVSLNLAGMVYVRDGVVASGAVIRDRKMLIASLAAL